METWSEREKRQVTETLIKGLFDWKSLTSHHEDSLDQFLLHHIPQVVSEKGPLIVFSKDKPRCHVVTFSEFTVCKPCIKTANGTLLPVNPMDCRIRNISYLTRIHFTVTHSVYAVPVHLHPYLSNTNTNTNSYASSSYQHTVSYTPAMFSFRVVPADFKLLNQHHCKEYLMVQIPTPVNGETCYLSEDVNAIRNQEDPYDPKGFMITNGSEKVIVPQLGYRNNYFFIKEDKKVPGSFKGEYRAHHEQKARSSSTMYFYLKTKKQKKHKWPELLIELPFIKRTKLTLYQAMRLLHVPDKKTMFQMLMDHTDVPGMEYLVRCILRDSDSSLSYTELCDKIARQGVFVTSAEKRIKHIKHVSMNELLPNMLHCQNENVQLATAKLVAYLCMQMLLKYHGKQTNKVYVADEDRDHLAVRRVVTPGWLMTLQFRQQLNIMFILLQKKITVAVNNRKYFNISDFLNSKPMTSSMVGPVSTGKFGTRTNTSHVGVAQTIQRSNFTSGWSHMRRIQNPVKKGSKITEMRQLHSSHAFVIDPVETPEGENCGLSLPMSLSCHIRLGWVNSTPIIDLLWQIAQLDGATLVPLDKCEKKEFQFGCKLMVNGIWVGNTTTPLVFLNELRMYKRYQLIPFDTSISYFSDKKELLITSDSGALLHPVFNLTYCTSQSLKQLYSIYKYNPLEFWKECMLQGLIEYIDKEEEKMYKVAWTWDQVMEQSNSSLSSSSSSSSSSTTTITMKPFTHCEIDPTLMLGVCASAIPFLEHNQAPRNMYQSNMGRQNIGTSMSNHHVLPETKRNRLLYPQEPITMTNLSNLLHHDQLPSFTNVRIGFHVDPHNNEDAIVVNRSILDSGAFNIEITKLVRGHEIHTSNTDYDVFEIPVRENTRGMLAGDYSKLDTDGLITPGTWIKEKDVLIGKVNYTNSSCSSSKNPQYDKQDRSFMWKGDKGQVTSVKLIGSTHKDEWKQVRMNVVSTRQLLVGDKLSSLHAQKGIVGRIKNREDMIQSIDGIPLDIIVNPHGLPSRMTLAHILEALFGKYCCMAGKQGDATPFRSSNKSDLMEEMKQLFKEYNMNPLGLEQCINGETGQVLPNKIYIGVMSYQRLKHQVLDKYHARARGPVQILTRQPNEGRNKDGGIRTGEMERDCLIAHGVPHILQDRTFLQSDPFTYAVCNKCGVQALKIVQTQGNRFGSIVNSGVQYYCSYCKSNQDVYDVKLPYCAKLMQQELLAAHMVIRDHLVPVDPSLSSLSSSSSSSNNNKKRPLPQPKGHNHSITKKIKL